MTLCQSRQDTRHDWWRGATLYQIYPRSFVDANGDGIGDLTGITSRLEHVASLNVDAIWLSPICTSPMDDFGYDVSDYRDVDPMFGTLADFDALVARAHDLGLKVVIDHYPVTSVHGIDLGGVVTHLLEHALAATSPEDQKRGFLGQRVYEGIGGVIKIGQVLFLPVEPVNRRE